MNRCVCLLGLAIWLFGVHAAAQPPAAQPPADPGPPSLPAAADTIEQARTAFDEGVAAFDAGETHRALEAFLRSYRIRPEPSLLYNIAITELRLARHGDALHHFELWLESASTDDRRRAFAEEQVASLHRRLGSDARVQVEVRVTAPGAEPGAGTTTVRPGERATLRIDLGSAGPRDEEGFFSSPWPWVVLGAGVLAAAATGFWLALGGPGDSLDGDLHVEALRAP